MAALAATKPATVHRRCCTAPSRPAALARRRVRDFATTTTMMVMGYFRSSSTKSATAAAAAKNRKKAKTTREEVGLREALLDQPAAAAEGGVPKGYFAVYAGESSRRFVVPTGYLREPAFRDLMERAADEFGFAQAGGLRVPCAEEDFEDLLRRLQRKNGGAAGKGKNKAVVAR